MVEGNDEHMEGAKPLPLHQRCYAGKLLEVSQVAKILKVNPATVRRWIKTGKMSAIQLPGGMFKVDGLIVDNILKEYQPDDDQ